MMRVKKGFKKVHIISLLILVFSFLLMSIVWGVASDPGTDGDPLVTKSYVDSAISVVKQLIEQQDKASKFEPIEVKAGKQVIASASAEIILRSGKATAIAGEKGGLSDLISGQDLLTGAQVTPNHLLLVPRDDGRGLKAVTDIWILIKGRYEIK